MAYRIARPIQEVRLRNWKPGQVAQLKTAIAVLEKELNAAMVQEAEQSTRREVGTRVPTMTDDDWTVTGGYRSFNILLSVPRGIDDLLFFELEYDDNSAFASPTIVRTVSPAFSVAHASGGTMYFRVRVVNSKFETAAWSSTETSASSVGKAVVTQISNSTATVNSATWTEVSSTDVAAFGGQMFASFVVGLEQVTSAGTNDMNVHGVQVTVDGVEKALGRLTTITESTTGAGELLRGHSGICTIFWTTTAGTTYTVALNVKQISINGAGSATAWVGCGQILEFMEVV